MARGPVLHRQKQSSLVLNRFEMLYNDRESLELLLLLLLLLLLKLLLHNTREQSTMLVV